MSRTPTNAPRLQPRTANIHALSAQAWQPINLTVGTGTALDEIPRQRTPPENAVQPSVKPLPSQAQLFLGLFLLLVVFALLLAQPSWGWLQDLQRNELYKRWSGFGLMLYMGAQWWLSLVRMRGDAAAAKRYFHRHKQVGLLAPVVFYLHSLQLGHAYLLLLSILYLVNVGVGLCHRGAIKIKNERFWRYWLIVHVALSVAILPLGIYHVVIAYLYR